MKLKIKSEKMNNRMSIKTTAISLATIVFAIALVGVSVLAQGTTTTTTASTTGTSTSTASFRSVHFLGKGIAVNPANPLLDVHIITMGAADVDVGILGTTTTVSVGVLNFENSSYILKNLNIGDGTASGDVFTRPYGTGTQVGSFTMNLLGKATGDLWTGTVTINGQTWNVYLLEGNRVQTPDEEKNSVGDYCSTHPTDGTCIKGIENFCQSNPQDARCVDLLQKFCKTHLGDSSCRQDLRNFCSQHSNNDKCSTYCLKFPAVCGTTTTTTSSQSQTTTVTSSASATTTTTAAPTTATTTTTTASSSSSTTTTSASTTTTTV